MKFSDKAGTISADPSHLHTFMNTWFEEGDSVCLVGMPAEGYRKVMSQVHTREEILAFTEENIQSLTRVSDTGVRVNMYLAVNPISDPSKIELYSRGSENNVESVYGCFIDFDVLNPNKSKNTFATKEDIYDLIDRLEYEPTIVVDNGIHGGVHAYWRFNRAVEVNRDIYRAIITGWWAHVQSKTDKMIDRLVDVTRISRMPSSVYWPKDGGSHDTVKVVSASGKRYDPLDIVKTSEVAYTEHVNKLTALAREKNVDLERRLFEFIDSNAEESNEFVRKILNLHAHNRNIILTSLENHINNTTDWSDILEPYGWTHLRTDGHGANVWSRPGSSDKSAVTDFVHPDGNVSSVMSLFSSAEETGLSDLKEAGVLLTKLQVMLRLTYQDNVSEMLADLIRKAGGSQWGEFSNS